jgi:hypothetical protein
MQMRKYASSRFIKLEDLNDGPLQKTIKDVEEGKFDKPILIFDDGTRLSLNGTNVSTLICAFGTDDSNAWIGQRIELYAGTVRFNGNDKPAVLVRALAAPTAAAQNKPQPPFGDTIPF